MKKSFEESVREIVGSYEAPVPGGLFEGITDSLNQPVNEPVATTGAQPVNPVWPAFSGAALVVAALTISSLIYSGGQDTSPVQEANPSKSNAVQPKISRENKAASSTTTYESTPVPEAEESVSENATTARTKGNERANSAVANTSPEKESENPGKNQVKETGNQATNSKAAGEQKEASAKPETIDSKEVTAKPEGSEAPEASKAQREMDIASIARISARPPKGSVPLKVKLSAPKGASSYEWIINHNEILKGNSVQHTFKEEGSHTIFLKVTGEDGQTASDEKTVEALEKSTLYVPNSFTPNGDNVNDVFLAEGSNVESYLMQVYNIKGQKIFSTNHLNQAWSGEDHLSDSQNRDTYIVVIKASGKDGKDLSKHKVIKVFR